jgi:hypothetical protein
VHPQDGDIPEAQRLAASLVFFDDRRQRFVTWPDAVEAMRQDWPAGAGNVGLTLFTWINLIRLLEALHDPLGTPAAQLTEAQADALVAWSDQAIPLAERRRLITVARSGVTESICVLFRMMARSGYQAAASA